MNSMKLLILSDLHLELHPFDIDTNGFDCVILAGDISVKNKGVL